MTPYILVAVYALAVMRVTGLIVADTITAPARAWLLNRLAPVDRPEGPTGWRYYATSLMSCAWCVSIYVGGAGAVVWYTIGNNPVLVVCAAGLAFSQLAGMFSDVGRG